MTVGKDVVQGGDNHEKNEELKGIKKHSQSRHGCWSCTKYEIQTGNRIKLLTAYARRHGKAGPPGTPS
ncbi:hypothetical protein GCM10011375_31790 [Hymenobacter qilianensis]|uniref:Uncharacterized protein n=1 Tax=Hymenobacter qilianensis TaxID=1385715 RepID=A0ACB5PUY5_9BACT|nr:hypothetical protein GCM10011375_31790 [Hymenobacter qilianensis]